MLDLDPNLENVSSFQGLLILTVESSKVIIELTLFLFFNNNHVSLFQFPGLPETTPPHTSPPCSHEQERLQVWSKPLDAAAPPSRPDCPAPPASSALNGGAPPKWDRLLSTAWRVDPEVALAMAQRFPACREVASELQALLAAHAAEPGVQALPEAGMMLAADKVGRGQTGP